MGASYEFLPSTDGRWKPSVELQDMRPDLTRQELYGTTSTRRLLRLGFPVGTNIVRIRRSLIGPRGRPIRPPQAPALMSMLTVMISLVASLLGGSRGIAGRARIATGGAKKLCKARAEAVRPIRAMTVTALSTRRCADNFLLARVDS
jgi:hypothetical protein